MTPNDPSDAAADDPRKHLERAFALSRAGKASEAREAMELAALSGHGQAGIYAATWRFIGYGGEADPARAREFLERAVQSGEKLGLTMLASFTVLDFAGPRDFAKAAGYLVAAAKEGEPRALLQLAFLLPPEEKDRASLVRAAAARGNATAGYFHGRALCDSGNSEEGLRWLAGAARKGEPCALACLAAKRITQVTAARAEAHPDLTLDWDAVARNLRWPHERALPQAQIHREQPQIASFAALLSPEECDYLMSRGAPYLRRAYVAGEGGRPIADKIRTNDTMMFGPVETDAFIQSLDSLVARALGEPPENGERFALLRYRPGQAYAPHCDWIDPDAPGKAEEVRKNGQRLATFLVYLNDGFAGGETRFVRLGWSYKGKKGDALCWRNVTRDGAIEPLTLHQGVTPASGEKWLLSKWMRSRKQTGEAAPHAH